MIQPDRIKIGAGVILISLDGLAREWCITSRQVANMMNKMKLPLIMFPGGEKRYVSLYPLEDYFFEMGLPEAYKGDVALVKVHHELAGVLYGTLTKEVIRERCKAFSRTLRTGALTYGKKSPKITVRKR